MSVDIVSLNALRRAYYTNDVQESSGTAGSASNVWVTLVSITGAGWVYTIVGRDDSVGNGAFRITIDGGTPITLLSLSASVLQRYGNHITLPLAGMRFDVSVLVEYRQADGTSYNGTAAVIWGSV